MCLFHMLSVVSFFSTISQSKFGEVFVVYITADVLFINIMIYHRASFYFYSKVNCKYGETF